MSFYSCGWTVISPPDQELPEGCNRPVATEACPVVLGTVSLQTPVETPPPTPVSGLLPFCLPEPKDNVTSAYSSGAPGLTFPCPPAPDPPTCSFLVPCPAADTQPDGSPASSCPPPPHPQAVSVLVTPGNKVLRGRQAAGARHRGSPATRVTRAGRVR